MLSVKQKQKYKHGNTLNNRKTRVGVGKIFKSTNTKKKKCREQR
jgi:hypothetical protein